MSAPKYLVALALIATATLTLLAVAVVASDHLAERAAQHGTCQTSP